MKSQPSLMHKKRSEVLLHHLPKFKSLTYRSTSAVRKNSPVSFHQLSSHRKVEVELSTYEVENIGWFILKFNLLLVSSTKSPMLSEVAGLVEVPLDKSKKSQTKCLCQLKRAKYAKIHTATSSVQLYLLSGRSSSCALPS